MSMSSIAQQAKLRDSAILAAVPALGFLFGAPSVGPGTLGSCLILFFGLLLLYSAARWLEKGDVSTPSDSTSPIATAWLPFLIFLGISFLIFLLFFRELLLYSLVLLGLAGAYFSAFTRFQRIPLLSTMVFFVLNLVAFVAGFRAASGASLNGWLFGIYFALIFAAGQLVGELAEPGTQDNRADRPNAETFGADRVLRFSFSVFLSAFVYLVVLSVANFRLFIYFVPFMIAFFGQTLLFLRLGGKTDEKSARGYQFGYRVIYFLAAAGYAAIRLAMTVS